MNENTDAFLESDHHKNDVSFFHNTGEINDHEENDDREIAADNTDFNKNDDKDNNDDDNSSASSEGFKRAVAI